MKTSALLTGIWIGLMTSNTFSAYGQCRENLAAQDQSVIERKVLFEDSHQNKEFKSALAPLHWLLLHAPALSTNLYIKGAEVFSALIREEKDARKQQNYFDSLMIIFDLRIKNCGDEANVIARKAISFYNYQHNGPRAPEILPLMDKAIQLNGNLVPDGVAEAYMTAVKIAAANSKTFSEENILKRYDKITSIIDAKIQKASQDGKSDEQYQKWHKDNLAILETLVNINCEFVRKMLAPKFKADPKDINTAKKIFNFMLKDNCSDDPLWLEAAEAIDAAEKDFGLKKYLGIRYLKMNDFDKAGLFFKDALALAKVASDKAEMLGYLGFIEEKRGIKPKARDLYRQALLIDPNRKEVYEKIGDLYYNSFEECALRKHQAHDRLVFLVAFDMYEKAGETKKMNLAKSSFPSSEDLHELDYSRGQKIKVECWINEETILRTRN